MPRKPKQVEAPKIAPVIPVEETRRERFLRIGTARMNRVLDHIRLLGNLSTSNYEWEESDLRMIQEAIVAELGKAMGRFQKVTSSKPEFHFETAEDQQ